jgi:hypothetical protein
MCVCTAKQLYFLHVLTWVCVCLKAWLAACASLALQLAGMPRLRLRQFFLRNHLVHAICTHSGESIWCWWCMLYLCVYVRARAARSAFSKFQLYCTNGFCSHKVYNCAFPRSIHMHSQIKFHLARVGHHGSFFAPKTLESEWSVTHAQCARLTLDRTKCDALQEIVQFSSKHWQVQYIQSRVTTQTYTLL